ncbi:phosphatase PAP2 family protein [Lapillicoccus sp.]|jgi:membrane-associated phospholipid phosphatase|uniref:phosphatase PAP2 family protein n=1 Tax=Lapillicoccus sp. TaxID=1909287 RepID=UPI0025EE3B9C|nr:phosphatase PAP2 family protein [Lapillicoccus sp.]
MSVTTRSARNSSFVHRWDAIDRPGWSEALRDLALRVLGPAVVLWVVIAGIGAFIEGPLGGFQSESAVNRTLQSGRTPFWDSVTGLWSHVGNTEIVIGVCVVMVGVIWWLTRRWWVAVLPAIAITLQASVFVLATMVAGRARPDVPHLDPAPPTSSYPSGHVGASTALYLTLALLAQRIPSAPLRRVLTAICLLIPLLVLYARLYRGMHHVTDVTVGLLNGITCALLAWAWLRRRPRT